MQGSAIVSKMHGEVGLHTATRQSYDQIMQNQAKELLEHTPLS